MSKKVAVVTGANKGIGFAIVKGLCQKFDGIVYLTSRDDTRGLAAVAELNKLGLHPEYHRLDVADRNSIESFRDYIKKKHGILDILINNAAVAYLAAESYEENENVININYRSILTMQELIYPLVRDNGRILNISSECGHLCNIRNKYWVGRLSRKDLTVSDINEFVNWYLESVKDKTFNKDDIVDNSSIAAYRVAKVALTAITMIQQKELEHRNISVNSMHPGVVRTSMTNDHGFYSPDEAAETPIYLVLDAPKSLKGAYVWYDKKVMDWYDYKANYIFKLESLNLY